MTLAEIRAELPVLERFAYLNAGTFGPLPRASAAALEAWTQRALAEGRSGHAFFEEVLAMRVRLREAIAGEIGGDPTGVAITTSTTEGCNSVIAGLRLATDDEVVTTDAEHPGLLGALRVARVQVKEAAVSKAPAAEAIEVIEREITPKTRLIALSHVLWTTGQVIPVERLTRHGIPLLVDGAQAVGAIPVDVGALGCDFYTVSGQKWLCGPDATGALYIRPERRDTLSLTYPSYFSWELPDYEPHPDARCFESSWTPPGSVAGLLESMAFARGVGEERFAAVRTIAERCRELVAEHAEVITEPGQAGLVSFVPTEPAAEVVERLAGAGVILRDLPGLGWVRASCGWWTSEDDLRRLVAGLAAP